jgi:tetratricopeptide (TPR) repeat protein
MIIALALVTDTTRADAIAADWSKSVPSEYKLQDSLDVLTARAEVALARRNPQEALRLLRLSDVRGCASCFYPRYARVYDAMRRPDSVTAYYERYVAATQPGATGDGYELARAYRRLGEIYEERRDWKRAVQRYQDFVDLWEHADPMLQPAVKDVRARIERIRAKAG